MRLLILLLILLMATNPARAETELLPAFPDAMKGPAAAHGAVIWNHGASPTEANAKAPVPPVMTMFRDAGWDVYRLARGIAGDREEDSTLALLAAIDSLKAQGYAKLVTAGQSFGAWISLNAAGRTDKLRAVLVNAPAAYGDASYSGFERNATLLYPKLEQTARIPIVISFFNRDLFDPSGRGPKAERILSERGVPHLIIDRPAVLEGHIWGSSVYFAQRFGPCWLDAAETGQAPALSACESHWGEDPSPQVELPADLTITPGGLAGKWYGNFTIGQELLLAVTRIDGSKVEGVMAFGPTGSAHGGRATITGQVIDGALVFVFKRAQMTLTASADGTASLLWATENARMAAMLHRVP